MNTPLWVQKLTDEQLTKMLDYVQTIEATGVNRFDEVWNIVETWYDQKVGIERLTAFCIDVWKEASSRWRNRN